MSDMYKDLKTEKSYVYKFECNNCKTYLNTESTDKDMANRLYFSRSLDCPICGIGKLELQDG